ncbi:helix-turn-helix domain-containing protein [Glutamicibacter sp. AOP5-A2-18]|uniref:helix-turn-helix domain-containing protein n=1 Tax=Glutamicibacter sp. AOP5-A2-18 TaxID=3457656 RepID=UPI004034E37D
MAALLRPAAAPYVASLTNCTPQQLLDQELPINVHDLQQALLEEHQLVGDGQLNERCAHHLSAWLEQRLPPINESGTLANTFLDHVSADRTALRVDQVATALNLTVRSLQRLSLKYLGLSPLSVIRRDRLQEAALHLREHPQASLATLAADLGYTDQAHMSTDFRKVLGYSPSDYRSN